METATDLGYVVSDAMVLQDSNNTVLWLQPHQIIAKVGTFAHSAGALSTEHAVAQFLAGVGAPVARPLDGTSPRYHQPTRFTVTLWERLEVESGRRARGSAVGESLREVHDAFAQYQGDLPSFRDGLVFTRGALADDTLMWALPVADRRLLRDAFDELLARLDTLTFAQRPLHGEPHENNFLLTRQGVRWFDFEAACIGPLEWDLASLNADALAAFPEHDASLLDLLRILNSARVATWGWARADIPEMRRHGEHHLEVVRAQTAWP